MKNIIYAFLTLSLMFLSCSHVILYQEADYTSVDSPYPSSAKRFAYHANGKPLSSSLVKIGDNILQKAKSDEHYKSYQQSAVNFEKGKNKNAVLLVQVENTVSDVKNVVSAQKSSEDHADVINKMEGYLNMLPEYNETEFQDCWIHIYQLSHRGLLQHYMNSDAEYNGLSNNDKALAYGYILKKNLDECDLLASAKVNSDKKDLSGLIRSIRHEISRRQSILKAIEKERKAEVDRLRKAERERIAREQAQQRRNDPTCSWLEGHWLLINPTYGYAPNLYFSTDRQRVKYHLIKIGDISYHRPDYDGPYTIDDGEGRYSGYKVIHFGDTFILANPETGRLYDGDGNPFEKKY